MSGLRMGVALANQHPRDADQYAGLLDQLRIARRAEELGWDSVWTGQHFLLSGLCMLQPVPYLARIAGETERLRLGLGIALAALLNPVQLAEDLASLDVVSGGRLIAGFALGYREEEFAAFGVAKRDGVRRFTANVQAIRHLWEGGDTVDLEWCRVAGNPLSVLPLQKPTPPIWIGAHTDAAVRRAARIGDSWYMSPNTTFETIRAQLALFDAERAAAGLPPASDRPIAKEVICAATTELAWETGGPLVAKKYQAYANWGQDGFLPDGVSFRADLKTLSQDRFVIGSAQECRRQLAHVVDAIDPTHLVLRVHWPGMPAEVAIETLERLTGEVVPYLGGGD